MPRPRKKVRVKFPKDPFQRLIDKVMGSDSTLTVKQASKAVRRVLDAIEQSGAMSDGLLVCSKCGDLVDDSGEHHIEDAEGHIICDHCIKEEN